MINRLALLICIAATSLCLLAAENVSAEEPHYHGNKNCNGCHEKETHEWQQSTHAKAFELLAPGKRVRFKKKAGLADIDYRQNVFCQKCHTTGHGQDGGFVDIESTPEMAGVGCESCHGPSSKYRETHKRINFTRARARAEGQTYASLGDKGVCEKCHSVASPFNPGVNPKYIFDLKKRLREGTASFHEIRPLD